MLYRSLEASCTLLLAIYSVCSLSVGPVLIPPILPLWILREKQRIWWPSASTKPIPSQNTHTPRLHQVWRYARLSGCVNGSGWSTVEWCEIDWRLGNAPQETGTGIDPSRQSCVNTVVIGARRRRGACRSRQRVNGEVCHSCDMVKTLVKKGSVYSNQKMENQTSAKHLSSSISIRWSGHLNI